VVVVDRRPAGREAANGCSGASVSALTSARAESVERVAHSAVTSDTPRVQYRVVQGLCGDAAWIAFDGLGHLPARACELLGKV
jgi:hypothetical protein